MTFKRLLKKYRKKSGLRVQDICAQMGCSKSFYDHLEQGRNNLAPDKVLKLAQIFQLTPAQSKEFLVASLKVKKQISLSKMSRELKQKLFDTVADHYVQ